MTAPKYKLITRSDMDGLVSAMLFKQLNMIDEIQFAHPKDVQDGKIPMDSRCITANLPYQEGVYMAFDHHMSETVRNRTDKGNLVIDPHAPSAAHVVYEYFGGRSRFPAVPDELMAAVDKADSARFSMEDVLNPRGWELLSFLMDSRTGLGRFKEFTVPNYTLMMQLIDDCLNSPIEDILKLPDVAERVDLFFAHQEPAKEQICRCTSVHKDLAVLDLRGEETIYATNRFMIYALFPQASVSMHVLWGLKQQNTVFALGRSIFNRTSTVNLGTLALSYGGGGHEAAATCQVDNEQAEQVKAELIAKITA